MDTGPKQRRKINPRYKANLFSVLTFGWTLETFKLGYSRDIRDNDLYAPLPEHQSDILGDAMQKAWDRELENFREGGENIKPSLWRVLTKVFGAELMLYGLILAAMEFLIRLQQPLFLGLLLRYYSPAQDLYNSTVDSTYFSRLFSYYDKESGVLWGEAVFFAFGVVFCSTANVMVAHPFMMGVTHLGMKMRVGVCSLIYRKSLKVSLQSMSENSAGLVVNLMANDVNRFDTGPSFIHYLWIGPVETMLMTVYLYREMGISAVYGALIVIAVVPFQICLGVATAYYRNETAFKSDERVKLMKEIVMGIEVIKMYTWEMPFRKIIDTVRRQEIRCIKMTSYIRGLIMSFIMFTARFSIFVTVLLYVTYVNRITVENVFFLTCYYNIMRQTMTLFFPQAVGQIAEMHVAIQRIRDFLLSEECDLPPREQLVADTTTQDKKPKKRVTISIDPVEIKRRYSPVRHLPEPSTSKGVPKDKSEHSIKEEIIIKFENAFSRWIKSSNEEDVEDISFNIMSGSLTTIIGAVGSGKSTLLHMMLSELPTSRGSVHVNGTLSYACQDPWLFVGSVRQNILFGQPFQKSRYMEVCKVCALERDISLFPHGDKTVVGERGVSLSGGQRARINLARAVYKEADIYLLDDPLSAVDTQVARHIFEKCIKRYLASKTVVLVTHQIQFIKSVDQIIIMDKGKILAEGGFEDLNEQELAIIQLMQDKTREVREDDSVPNLTSQSMLQASAVSLSRRNWSIILDTSVADQKPEAEAQAIGRVRSSVYQEYFLAGTTYFYVFIAGILFLLAQFFASASDFWISKWSQIEDHLTGDSSIDQLLWSQGGLYRRHYVIIFGILTIATVAVALCRAFMFFSLCMKSSIKLHDQMFDCVSQSPMSFFHSNPSGRILNRFSKDMGSIDELLPQAMLDCFQIILNLAGVIVVILMTDITMLIPITTSLIIFYIFRIIYVRTTSAIKRLEGITRSPVFGHVNATVLGLATIRSFGAEGLLTQEFDHHQDLHSAAWYLFITCSRAFGYFLDIICLLFIVCVTFSCLMKTDNEGSNVGLVITQSISLTGVFQWGMRQSAEMENQMTSVERVLEYTKLPQEAALRSDPEKAPPADWPPEGAITFDNLSLKYTPDGNYVLHKLQFNVQPQEKIGIVGRTGAGKSSIIQALFRLAYLDGTIIIDGVDISTIGLHDLREKISIIPQEPVLFSGTMRKNLDPFDEFSDETLLKALNNVELLKAEEGVEALYKEVSESGCNFSVGERQLVCLARAIVRDERVLLLDEATANVDAQTDALIQTAIRLHFQRCTVLTIAHRLNTVIDSDKILVLDAGRLMEYEHPHVLLQNKKGYFRKMVAETGPAMAAMLHKLAKESYLNISREE
ncbi:PREDICTED: probable multidrug resistance-associated protein lethal(2)03659 [Papilio xuthus]|uniref:Probable multidrug resistance-associated protein lethal(2)03659 n=1 Tax=Papilio xuthus TaxID=66420 RepID=A0AAJ7E8H6_PAPXU|nr:PREDICTED: probable multidrug resistance-associated protein lethal(2)03659 [Papilio xuthus]